MKIEIKESVKKRYPFLGIYGSGIIVYFTDLCEGICLKDGGQREEGVFYNDWNMDNVKLFTGSITLSND